MIRESLDGKRIFLTGATGFLGTNVLERLLRSVPGCHVTLLVRPGRRSSIEQRVKREILRNDAFDRLRTEHGKDGFEQLCAERLAVVAGDVSRDGLGLDDAGRAALADVDVVIHSAATVSFDSPLDSAVEVNLLGPTRIARTLADLGVTPHLVAVSTCYVAGSRRGRADEEHVGDNAFFVDVDWQAEVDGARRARSDNEAASRTPEKLAEFRKRARRELGAAGGPLLAEKTEQLRSRWVAERMVDAGRARAASLGWPDAYAYTKALGERALLANRGDVPVSIVRPSIIESAWAEPKPGWIRGFRMAEPVIISYARGLLKEFPGVPEGTVDVIPVDLVTAAIIAVAARGPERNDDGVHQPDVVQVASGSANPLRYKRLVDLVSGYFTEHPLYDRAGQPIVVPTWSFPGRGRVQGQLTRAKNVIDRTEKALALLPLRGRQTAWATQLEDTKADVERALAYVELYGAYAECEAIYSVDRLLGLWDALDDADRSEFGFDPRVIDWDHYATKIHLPSVIEHARVRTTPGRERTQSRSDRLRKQVLAPERQLAAFDLENTLIASNVVASYAWLASRRLDRSDRVRFTLQALRDAPGWLAQDRKDRSDFLRFFYRNYDGAPIGQLEEDAAEMFSELLLAKSFPAGIRRVREHRRLGHRTVLITGALDVVVDPLRPLFDDVIAASLGSEGGRLNGELTATPPTGETRAQVLADYADEHGYDLAESVAYADSASDLPMLELVGFPVAVNPETRLAALARTRGWLVEDWGKAKGMATPLLPMAAPADGRPGFTERLGQRLERSTTPSRRATTKGRSTTKGTTTSKGRSR
ncbi:MAG: HAD-IB family hydrolase [Acidimicrobiia bacterium]|nr:HAD-IB family hydrolase [Acidimicrobiia bacterium]